MSLIDPELLPLLDLFPPLDFATTDLPGLRAVIAAQIAAMPPAPPSSVTMEHRLVPAGKDRPAVRALYYRPAGSTGPVPAILHLHGGGYMLGSPEMMDQENRATCLDLGCAILSVDYRLAPETPHPGPIEDCYAALCWLHREASSLGIDATRIGVKGESAGGGLAAALALLARDRGEVPLAFQHLIFPMLDDRTCVHPDPHPHTGELVWTNQQNAFGWASLLGQPAGSEGVSPYAAAARATDLSGLPPCFISVGALDLFLEENMEYARRLTRAGVPVELHVYPGAFHGFIVQPAARVAQAAERDSRAALTRSLLG